MNEISSKLRELANHIDECRLADDDCKLHTLSMERIQPILNFGAIADQIYKARRKRDQLFGISGLFSDPAWDILLDLLRSESQLNRVSVSSACIAACVPATTALRWLTTLEEYGLIERHQDPADARRTFVSLTRQGRKRICDALQSGSEAGGRVGSSPESSFNF